MIAQFYQWEVEGTNGVIRQYNDDGTENPSTLIDPGDVIRASIIPYHAKDYPRHDILLDMGKGEKFVRRFGRGIMKQSPSGFKVAEYLQVIETTNYRLWVFSSTGQCLITNPTFEVYI